VILALQFAGEPVTVESIERLLRFGPSGKAVAQERRMEGGILVLPAQIGKCRELKFSALIIIWRFIIGSTFFPKLSVLIGIA
jgi:hypothetical protein